MYGFQAIEAQNGWAMALTGVIIVMTGLTILATIISQLHRIIGFFENRQNKPPPHLTEKDAPPVAEPRPRVNALSDLDSSVARFHLMTTDAGETFELTTLHQILTQNDDPHPHLTIRSLREQGYLVSAGEGYFSWKRL